jgi:CO dehydrogenase/acetyl-CoA synthase gamma subunit (corrinoid Fe-S protein)
VSNQEYCCGSTKNEIIQYMPVSTAGKLATDIGDINIVSTHWCICDYIGEIKVRLDIGRMRYAIAPGLYAAGKPGRQSPVLVSANYKLSFDVLRKNIAGLDAWILVLDSKGVNVWCAAGKGTFSTQELIDQILKVKLDKIVDTRQLIIPQLGAPGISAHIVAQESGFAVFYGPV